RAQDPAQARGRVAEPPRQLACAGPRLQSRRQSAARLPPPSLLRVPHRQGGAAMIRHGALAALLGLWAVSLPGDLHTVQRVLLAAGVVPLLRLGHHLWRKRAVTSRLLILGNGPIVSKLIEELESSPAPRYVLTGVLDNQPLREGTRAVWLGRLDR